MALVLERRRLGTGRRWAVAGIAMAAALTGCAPNLQWRIPTPDHRGQVEVREEDGLTCVWVDSLRDGCYDGVALETLVFSGDGRHRAYAAEGADGWRVVRDGAAGPAWPGVSAPTFSPDGDHLAYAAWDGSAWRVVQDDRPGEPWDSLLVGTLTFARRGESLAYVAARAGRYHAVHDGVAGPGYDAITLPRLGPDGSRLAYVAWSEFDARLVVDGAEGPPVTQITEVVFSPDGRRVAYVAQQDGPWYVLEERSALGPFEFVEQLGFDPATGARVFIAPVNGGEAVHVDGDPGPVFEAIEPPVIAESGRWGYIAARGDSSVVVLDGRILAREEHAGNLVIAPDGGAYAYIAERGPDAVVVDETGATVFDVLIEGSLVFCADQRTWACAAGDTDDKRLYVAVEGSREQPGFDWDQITRLIRQSVSRGHGPESWIELIRAWVAAEAELLLERRDGARMPKKESLGWIGDSSTGLRER